MTEEIEGENMAHIVEYKVIFELDDDKIFEPYLEEWVNNNAYARYRIIDEEYIQDYWTDERKKNIEDRLPLVEIFGNMRMYLNRNGIVYVTDSENIVKLAYQLHSEKVMYARDINVSDILKWFELGNGFAADECAQTIG